MDRVQSRLCPGQTAEYLGPTSPPDWNRLGWKVGWILREGYTGLQFWLTEEAEWEALTAKLGRNRRQVNSVFSRWYDDLLVEMGRDRGVPLNLESLRWRQMDLAEFPGKSLIERSDWWHVQLRLKNREGWHGLFPASFFRVFEEPEEVTETSLPWTFGELWHALEDRGRSELVRGLSSDRALLGQLANLILAGTLNRADVLKSAPREPRREIEDRLGAREKKLRTLSRERRRRILRRLKQEAQEGLARRVGSWVEEGAFSRGDWQTFREEWRDHRRQQLKETFGSARWNRFWKQLGATDIRQVVPRLDFSDLAASLTQLPRSTREYVAVGLSRRNREKLLEHFESDRDALTVYRARRSILEQGREVIERLDYQPKGEWTIPDPS